MFADVLSLYAEAILDQYKRIRKKDITISFKSTLYFNSFCILVLLMPICSVGSTTLDMA